MFDKDRPLSNEEIILSDKFDSFLKSNSIDGNLARDGFGHVVLKFKKKSFFMMGPDYTSGILNFYLKADKITQFEILKNKNFRVAPYLGHHGWVQIQGFEWIQKEFDFILQIILKEIEKLGKLKKRK